VIVCEIDPVKAAEAWMDGFEVLPMEEAAETGDFFVTVTGCTEVIRREHIEKMKDGAILANAGHFDVEVSKPGLEGLAREVREARNNIRSYVMEDGRQIYLLADGRLVNLAAGDGHPAEIMDMTFSLQVSSLLYLTEHRELEKRVYRVPEEIDREVAEKKLASLGLRIDSLTEAQKKYMASWRV
jgi:adenosylhomocysteinase